MYRTIRLLKEGKLKTLSAEPPWPTNIISASGELPEYVVSKEEDGIARWIAADLEKDRKENKISGFYYRARVDLELVVDGQIIDLDSMQLPDNTPIRDKRFKN